MKLRYVNDMMSNPIGNSSDFCLARCLDIV